MKRVMEKREPTESSKTKIIVLLLIILIIILGISSLYKIFITGKAITGNVVSSSDLNNGLVLYYSFDNLTTLKLLSSLNLADGKDSFDRKDLRTVLRKENYIVGDQKIPYSQTINFSDSFKLGYGNTTGNQIVLGMSTDDEILRYNLVFSNPVVIQASSSIKMLGRDYYIFSYQPHFRDLVLINTNKLEKTSISKNISSNSVSRITTSQKFGEFDIKIKESSDITSNQVKLNINGEDFELGEKEMAKVPDFDNIYVGVENIFISGGIGTASLVLALDPIEIKNNERVKYNENFLNNTLSTLSATGELDYLSSISILYRGGLFVYPGKNYILPVFETINLTINNFSPKSGELTRIKSFSNKLNLSVQLKNGQAEFGLLYYDNNSLKLGESLDGNQMISGTDSIDIQDRLFEKQQLYSTTSFESLNAPSTMLAQTFTVGSNSENISYTIDKVGLKLAVSNSACLTTQNCSAKLMITEVDSAGKPDLAHNLSAPVLITTKNSTASQIILASPIMGIVSIVSAIKLLMSTSYTWHYIEINPARLEKGKTYAIVIMTDNGSSSYHLRMQYNNVNDSYPNASGWKTTNAGTTWTALSKEKDFAFEILGQGYNQQYFVASWKNDTDQESYLLRVKGISSNSIILVNKLTNSEFTINLSKSYRLGNLNLTLNSSYYLSNNVKIKVAPAENGVASFNRIYTKEGLEMQLPNTGSNASEIKFRGKGSENFSINLMMNNNTLTATSSQNGIFDISSLSTVSYSNQLTRIEIKNSGVTINYTGNGTNANFTMAEIRNSIYPEAAILDISGHNASGIIYDTEIVSSGFGKSANLTDGSYIEMFDNSLLKNLNKGSYTISAWYKPEELGNEFLVTKTNQSTKPSGLSFRNTSSTKGRFYMTSYEGNTAKEAISDQLNPGIYYHVVGVVDRSAKKVRVYLNGEFEDDTNLPASSSALDYGNTTWKIGQAEGILDEVKVWNRALSSDEISALYDSYEEPIEINIIPAGSCSPSGINSTWKSVFNISMAGAKIVTSNSIEGDGCSKYLAIKDSQGLSYILIGNSISINESNKVYHIANVSAVISNLEDDYKANLTALDSFDNLTFALPNDDSYNFIKNKVKPRSSKLSKQDAQDTLQSILGIKPRLTQVSLSDLTNFQFSAPGINGQINSNNSYIKLDYGQKVLNQTGCEPDIVAANTSCRTDNTLMVYYIENGTNCGVTLPANETLSCTFCTAIWNNETTACMSGDISTTYFWENGSSCNTTMDNITTRCDYDNNNILGQMSDIDTNLDNLKMRINSQDINFSVQQSGLKTVDLIDGNTKITFNFNFNSTSKLDLSQIRITENPSSSSFAYLIVNGIDKEKTVQFDRKNNSDNAVCIIDDYVGSISEVSSNCKNSDETLVNCTGAEFNGYTCSIQDNQFVVTGLMHSAIKEYSPYASTSSTSSSSGTTGTSSRSTTTTTSGGSGSTTTTGTTEPTTITPEPQPTDYTLFYVIAGILIVLIAIILVLVIYKKRKPQTTQPARTPTYNYQQYPPQRPFN